MTPQRIYKCVVRRYELQHGPNPTMKAIHTTAHIVADSWEEAGKIAHSVRDKHQGEIVGLEIQDGEVFGL